MTKSDLERTFEMQCRQLDLPAPIREYRFGGFSGKRRWRFDFAWSDCGLCVEIEGGTWSFGRHVRGKGFEADCEKYNQAALLGWKVLRFTGKMIEDGTGVQLVERVLKEGG